MTQLQSSSIVVCNVARMYVPSGLKAISIEAAVAMINIFISLFGTQANGLVIMVYYRNPRLRNVQNTIFLLLAITDFNVTAFVEPIYVVAILDSFLENRGCVGHVNSSLNIEEQSRRLTPSASQNISRRQILYDQQ